MSYALVTGASKGIGKAIAEELAKRQFDLLLVARSGSILQQQAEELAGKYGIKTAFLGLDLSEANAARQVFNWCHNNKYDVSVLVNNAGYGLSGGFERFSLQENINMMQLNMMVPIELCQLFLPLLRQQPKAYILNIASSAAYQAVPNLSLYAATKSFVLQFGRGLSQELKKSKSSVSITTISPGATDTGFVERAQIGTKGAKAAERLNMTPEAVAVIGVKAMFARKPELIIGLVNKLGAFMSWLMPKSMVEKTVMKLYE